MELKSDEKKYARIIALGQLSYLIMVEDNSQSVIGHFHITLELEIFLRTSDRPKILLPK